MNRAGSGQSRLAPYVARLVQSLRPPQVDDLTLNGDYTAPSPPAANGASTCAAPTGPPNGCSGQSRLAPAALAWYSPCAATPPPTAESTLRICWEDRTGESSDYDHNDLILEMTFVPLPQN